MRFLILCVLLLPQSIWGLINLEEELSDFVLETRQLSVPGYPIAFNPSIIRWQGRLLMTFRVIPDRKHSFNSEIGVVWLDDQFRAISVPQILDLRPAHVDPEIPSRAEDACLIEVDGTLYIVYDDNRDEQISRGGFRVYIAKLEVKGDEIIPYDIEAIVNYEWADPNVREKNWIPFTFQNELLMVYSISPHRILRYLPFTGSCETFCETSVGAKHWVWGHLRGSTAALPVNEGHLAFFHSSIKMETVHSGGNSVLHYFIGAYLFSSEPPFEILRMSPRPIVGRNFYFGETHKPYWHPIRAVFPRGFLIEGNKIFLFYGRQDHEIWVASIDKERLIESLVCQENSK